MDVVPHAHLAQIDSTGFSQDGAMFAVRFRDRDGNPFALHMDVERMRTLMHALAQGMDRNARGELPADRVSMRFPRSFSIGYSEQMRGRVAVTFDEKTVDEMIFVLPTDGALNMAAELERLGLSQMTPEERHAWARKKNPLLMPLQPKLIIPGSLP